MKQPKILDDALKVLTGAIDTTMALCQQLVHQGRLLSQKLINRLDVVPRSELEVVKSMAAQARLEQQKLQERLDQLEQHLKQSMITKLPDDKLDI